MCKSQELFACPVCGYAGLDEAPYDEFGCSSFGICPCCGTEFGYDDSSVAHAHLRKKWISRGMLWWSKHVVAVSDWDPVEQMRRAGMEPEVSASLVLTEVREFEFGWLFFYNSNSGDISDALAGNAPFLIDSNAGDIHVLGTANPIEFYLRDFQWKGA